MAVFDDGPGVSYLIRDKVLTKARKIHKIGYPVYLIFPNTIAREHAATILKR